MMHKEKVTIFLAPHTTHKYIVITMQNFQMLNLLVGHAVAQLVEALLYKPEGRVFDSRWCHWNFLLT